MHILITNDDGVRSPGLLALKQALEPLGDVSVVAPDRNWSAGGHSRTLFSPLRANPTRLADGTPAFECDGTPADCVALAVKGLLPTPPDLVVSGINLGANLGHDVLYSGTVAAAMEALILGVPGIAVSLVHGYKPNTSFEAARMWASRIVAQAIQQQLPADVLLNINIPPGPPEAITAAQVVRLGERIYPGELVVRHDPRGRPYYWIGGEEPTGKLADGTDLGTIAASQVAITPLHFDLTSMYWIERLQSVRWQD